MAVIYEKVLPEAESGIPIIPMSFAFAPHECTPIQKSLNRTVNALELAYERNDTGKIARLGEKAQSLLNKLEEAGGDGHSDPNWLVLTQRANVASAHRRLDEAIAGEVEALEAAKKQLNRAKSLNNLSDHYRRAGRLQDAIYCGIHAVVQFPDNDGFASTLAAALYESGRIDEADRIIDSLSARTDIHRPGNVLAVHLLHQPELRKRWDRDAIARVVERMIE